MTARGLAAEYDGASGCGAPPQLPAPAGLDERGIPGLARLVQDIRFGDGERDLLRTIIDALPDFVHVKDVDGRIQLGNKAWLQLRGLDENDVLGKTVFDIFPADVAQWMHDEDVGVMTTGEAVVDREQLVPLMTQQGRPVLRWVSATKVPMRDSTGRITGLVGISRDITERRRMERERAMEHVVARVLSESRSIEDTMPRLIQTVCEAMEWAYGAYWHWNPEAQRLQRRSWWSASEFEFHPDDEAYWLENSISPDGLLGRAWVERRANWISDVEVRPTLRRAASCQKLGLRSAYAFPIFIGSDTIGVIEFFGRTVREPDEALLEVSGAISHQIGQFIRRKTAEEGLQENEQQLRTVFDCADIGISMTDVDMRFLRVNDKFCSIVGYERDELLAMRSSEVNLESNVEAMRGARARMLAGEITTFELEKQLVRKDGSLVWVSTAMSLVRSSDGEPRYFIAATQDISESKRAAEALKQSEEQYRVLAHYDQLTKLPNRALFYDRLSQALAHARRSRCWLAVLFIDIDRFKEVNDTFGHAAGDELLIQVSKRLSSCVRAEDTVGRLSGDEFAVILSRLTTATDAATVAHKIVDALNQPVRVGSTGYVVTASVGIAVFPTDGVDGDMLIRNADTAMYRAKQRGRNNYQFYTA